MNPNDISILIKAKDQASPALKQVASSIDATTASAKQQSGVISGLKDNWGAIAAVSATAGVAMYGLLGQMSKSVDAANRLQAALMGLNSVATAFQQDAGRAEEAARSLAQDGLMTVTESATGLKNLLASGFSLDEAVTLMTRFKDSAAFGRQASLGFGQAVASATEGIKNGNSILVDNAGVTKNLSIMLTEAGFSASDLSKATTDASVRQAIFNGILKETNPQVGDAGRLAGSAAGQQAQLAAQTEVLYQQIGTALQPALLALLQVLTPIIQQVAGWVAENPQLAATLIIGTTAVMGLTSAAGALGMAIMGLGPVFAAFKVAAIASITGVSAAWSGMAALVMSPIAMPAIAVAAAIAALMAVKHAAQETHAAISEAQAAAESAHNSQMSALSYAQQKRKSGEWTEAEYQRIVQSVSGRASGGPVSAGTMYQVNEREPEFFQPSGSGSIIPLSKMFGAMPTGVTVNITGPVSFQSRSDIDYFANRLDKMQRLAKAGMA